MGDMVDSTVAALRNLEARRLPRAADLYAHALEHGVSTWHVFPGEPASFACSGLFAAKGVVACDGVDCARRMGGDRQRPDSSLLEKLSRDGPLTQLRCTSCGLSESIWKYPTRIAGNRRAHHRPISV